MENWGLSIFDPSTLLLNHKPAHKNKTSESRWYVSNIVAHELVHQWFGNLVTCNWWSQTWLNEGFATYFSYVATELVDNANLPWSRMVLDESRYAMYNDADADNNWTMTSPITSRTEADQVFGEYSYLCYAKGGSVLRMLEGFITEPAFRNGLSAYLKANSYESTTEDDLFFYLFEAGEAAGSWPGSYNGTLTFSQVMKTWTDQAGYPIITAVVDCSTPSERCSVDVSQAMFVTNGNMDTERSWTVPLFASVAGQSTHRVYWLENTRKVTLDLSDLYEPNTDELPLILNHDSYGYYRVMYDADHWRSISEVIRLDKEKLSILSRISIICDIEEFYIQGLIEETLYDEVTSAWNGHYSEEENWALEACGTSKQFKNKKNRKNNF